MHEQLKSKLPLRRPMRFQLTCRAKQAAKKGTIRIFTLMELQMPEMNGLPAMIAIHDEFPESENHHLHDIREGCAVRDKTRRSGLFARNPVG